MKGNPIKFFCVAYEYVYMDEYTTNHIVPSNNNERNIIEFYMTKSSLISLVKLIRKIVAAHLV